MPGLSNTQCLSFSWNFLYPMNGFVRTMTDVPGAGLGLVLDTMAKTSAIINLELCNFASQVQMPT